MLYTYINKHCWCLQHAGLTMQYHNHSNTPGTGVRDDRLQTQTQLHIARPKIALVGTPATIYMYIHAHHAHTSTHKLTVVHACVHDAWYACCVCWYIDITSIIYSTNYDRYTATASSCMTPSVSTPRHLFAYEYFIITTIQSQIFLFMLSSLFGYQPCCTC